MSDKEQICVYCGGKEESPIYCPNGHFVCDTCHSKDAIGFLEKLAEVDKSTDPMVVADNALS
ncbi:MAG: hypothetical protein ACXAB5_04985, partial [Candidatus Thorarchaeota archaeon]